MVAERRTVRAVVSQEQAHLRLDQFIPLIDEDISRSFARKLIDIGAVHLNQRRMRKCSAVLKAGDALVLHIDGLPLEPFVLADEHVVYRDKYLLVLDKPAGVDTQPTPSRYKGTLYAALLDYLKHPTRKDLKPSIGMVQRLDRDTSGLILFSIHPRAHKGLSDAFTRREVVKSYRALVNGKMALEEGEYRSLLARRHATNLMKSVERGGREAITCYRRISGNDLLTDVHIEIPTGRSHQIRAHFSEAGHPLLGDVRYGGPAAIDDVPLKRQMLHSYSLHLEHPVSKEALDFSSELPYDMNFVVQRFL